MLKLIRDARREHRLHNIAIYSNTLKPLVRDPQTESPLIVLDQPMRDVIQQVATDRQSLHHIAPSAEGDLIWTLTPVYTPTNTKKMAGLLIVGQLLPKDLMTSMAEITRGFENYQQMKMLKKPIKISHLIMLS
ncbi:MAG: hypothetical protein GWN93_09585, partial [Deltaproteobacteria bacterium]|nr:hypothetical protein [Deltaproteobacteria bacterium]